MNRDDLKKFRAIFEEEMNREGFVWKFQTYMHVDFEQYWVLGIWPTVAAQGHVFDMYHRMFLMNCFDEEDLKWIPNTEHTGRFSMALLMIAGHIVN